MEPELIPFSLPAVPREVICGGERMPDGHHARPEWQDVDWIGPANQGGGHVPDDYQWPSGPRERQERESMG
ncbi:MAG TPA: hypothetical protein VND93_18325 [Myxococcales bacterium]|nr:hypothetical protein [Myxococcales bacterium]